MTSAVQGAAVNQYAVELSESAVQQCNCSNQLKCSAVRNSSETVQ
ncbi:hypothetical protein [Crinalium epipsammum]|nr:hypothetical protein [Crinalium epipsammum]